MCGITGFLDPQRAQTEEAASHIARAMASRLHHRGPDDGGVWVDAEAGIAFGHRRLAIIDLSPTGAQPMVSADGRYVLSFNGEAYNHGELRSRLEAEGVVLRGASDTEVLLEAAAAWGLQRALDETDGMFALALWDRRERVLSLARDRVGEKPLFYGWGGKTLLFASELKALFAFPGFAPKVDLSALDAFLRYSYVPAPRSIFEGVHKLEPGTILEVAGAGAPRTHRYWSFTETAEAGCREPLSVDDGEAADLVEEALKRSVGLRMLADVPVGALLSGGVDSSTVVALMQAQSPGSARTFTIGFSEAGFDEASHAGAVARHLGTDHTELIATPEDALRLVPELARTYDEPFADSSQIPTMLVCALTRRSVTVALSGDGGDELFGGYVRHGLLERLWARQARVPGVLRSAAAHAIGGVRPTTWDRLGRGAGFLLGRNRIPAHLSEKAVKLARVLRAPDIDAAYHALVATWTEAGTLLVAEGTADGMTPSECPSAMPACLSLTEQVMLLDSLGYLPDDILVKVDRAAMSASLETRVPMLDHRLIELVWRLPRNQRVRVGQTKWLLRRILARHVPSRLIDRPKMGFAVPVASWLRGPLKDWADDLLGLDAIRREGYLEADFVRRLWTEHRNGDRDHAPSLWSVLMFQAWLERYRAMPSATATAS